MINKKFGYLTVIKKLEPIRYKTGTQPCYECMCDCGKLINVTKNHLKTGHTKSCGCKKSQMCIDSNFKHGLAGSRLYNTYYHMRRRCYNEKDKQYHRYGGRGITVCDEWLGENGFINFSNWAMNNGYNDTLTIDRINNDGNYEPNNCRWATPTEQMNNVSYNVRLTYNNETHTIAEWAKIVGLKQDTIQARIKYHNLSVEEALFKPPTCKKAVAVYKDDTFIGIFDSQKEAAKFMGVFPSQVCRYLKGEEQKLNGYHVERV